MDIIFQSGLHLMPTDRRRAVAAVAFCVVGVTIFVWLLDCVFFRDHLAAGYVAFYTSPLVPRVPIVCLLAMLDEVQYRLLLMSTLMLAATALIGRTPPGWCVLLIIIFAQAAHSGRVVIDDPVYGSLRYLVAGCIWGWLYWRHGWVSALTAHGFIHVLLDPLLLIGLK